jgi:hypothetical protein
VVAFAGKDVQGGVEDTFSGFLGFFHITNVSN